MFEALNLRIKILPWIFHFYKNSAKKKVERGVMEQARLGQLFLLLFEIDFRIRIVKQAHSRVMNCSGTDQRTKSAASCAWLNHIFATLFRKFQTGQHQGGL